jgi:ribosomal protein L40E
VKSSKFRCPKCGGSTQEVAGGIYCFKCDLLLDSKGQPIASKIEPAAPVALRPPAPPVGEFDVWIPVLLLVAMILLGSFQWLLGLFALIAATIYVHYNSKKFGIEGGRSIITLLIAVIGLPLYAYDLHKLRRAQQRGQLRTVIEPARPPMATGTGQQAPIAPTISPSTKFCRECGAKIPRDSIFCEECGAKVL